MGEPLEFAELDDEDIKAIVVKAPVAKRKKFQKVRPGKGATLLSFRCSDALTYYDPTLYAALYTAQAVDKVLILKRREITAQARARQDQVRQPPHLRACAM